MFVGNLMYMCVYMSHAHRGVRVRTCTHALARTSGHMIARVSRGMHYTLAPTHHAPVPHEDLVLFGTLSEQLG